MLLQRLHSGAALLVAAILAACSTGDSSKITAQTPSATANRSAGENRGMDHNSQFNWGPAPPIFPAGAQFAVVQGDPSVAGAIFTVRLRFPNGYILPPHTHPTDEHVTVLRGTFLVGLGEDFSKDALVALKEDGFITAPANMAHFASARGITEVQVHAIGPFQLTYVHPQDDPTK
ncbi:MAG TPA: cupin domain-containing protein [Gemmatimonadaceae bacterium]|nr:cupin domain-containing protein [Gemmatimonadaceae bacterium]